MVPNVLRFEKMAPKSQITWRRFFVVVFFWRFGEIRAKINNPSHPQKCACSLHLCCQCHQSLCCNRRTV